MTLTQKTTVKLTPHGKAVAEALRARKQEIIEENNGEYVADPWYKRYLSPDFEIVSASNKVTNNYIEASAELGIDTDEVSDTDDRFDENDDFDDEEDDFDDED